MVKITKIANATGAFVYASVRDADPKREEIKLDVEFMARAGPFGAGIKVVKEFENFTHQFGVAKIAPGQYLKFQTKKSTNRLATVVTEFGELVCQNYCIPRRHAVIATHQGAMQLGYGKVGQEFICCEGKDYRHLMNAKIVEENEKKALEGVQHLMVDEGFCEK